MGEQAKRKFSDEIEAALGPYRGEYWAIIENWVRSRTFGLTYPAFLTEAFHYTRHGWQLMVNASESLDRKGCRTLREYLRRHICEEKGHDQWVLGDIKALGIDPETVRRSPPLAETISLIGSQMYVIKYLHPAGILGYLYCVESQPPSVRGVRALQRVSGIPAQAIRNLREHAIADKQHRREIVWMVNHHVTTDSMREAVLISSVLGMASINRLMLRLSRGDYLSTLPTLLFTNRATTSLPSLPLCRSAGDLKSLSVEILYHSCL